MRTVKFNPFSYAIGKLLPNGKVYSVWHYNNNIDGIKDTYSKTEFNSFPSRYFLDKRIAPEQEYHFTKIQAASMQTDNKRFGMNYLLCKEFNSKIGVSSLKKTYIRESGVEIAEQIAAWKLGDLSQPVIASTRYAYDLGEQVPIALWMNGGSYTITLPPWLEFVNLEFTDMGYTPSKTWVKMFDYSYEVNGLTITITITPTSHFDTTGARLRGLRSVGHIIAKAVGTGDGYIGGVQEGYVFVE